jgi:1,4-dihydroxy-2-naphthoate octaprenyltransferase
MQEKALMESQNTTLNLLKVVRLHIVLGGVLAFTLGLLLGLAGGGTFNLLYAVLFYLIVFLGDLSTHYSNDYFDVNQDQHVQSFKFFSGRRILVKHPNLLPHARKIALALLSASILLGFLAVLLGYAPLEFMLIVVTANFLGWFYSAPPLKLVSRGLGEVAIAIAAGFAIPATGYLASVGRLEGLFWVFALPFVLYGFMLALSLEAPDIEVDKKSHRRNLGVRSGIHVVYGLVLAAAVAAFVWLALGGWLLGAFWVATAFAAVPLAAAAICVVSRRKPNAFSAANILALFAFNALMVAYLALIAL